MHSEFGGPSSREVHVNLSWNAVAPLNILVVVTAEESYPSGNILVKTRGSVKHIIHIVANARASQLERSSVEGIFILERF